MKIPIDNQDFYAIIYSTNRYYRYRGVEQLVARRAHNPKVVGSSPTPATTKSKSEMTCFFILELNMRYKKHL